MVKVPGDHPCLPQRLALAILTEELQDTEEEEEESLHPAAGCQPHLLSPCPAAPWTLPRGASWARHGGGWRGKSEPVQEGGYPEHRPQPVCSQLFSQAPHFLGIHEELWKAAGEGGGEMKAVIPPQLCSLLTIHTCSTHLGPAKSWRT